MKVLQINVVCNSGSTGKIAYDIHSSLKDADYESAIVYGRGALLDDLDCHRIASPKEVKTHAVLTRLTGYVGCFSPIATRKLLKFMDQYAPDVVHIHNLHGYYVNIAAVVNYLKQKNIKTVWTLHDEFMYTGKCGYSNECNKWQLECGNCPQVKEYPKSLFFDVTKAMHRQKKRFFEGFDNLTIVTPSKWLANRARQSFLGNKRIVVIPNGIDTSVFFPRETVDLDYKHDMSKVILHVTADFDDLRKGGYFVIKLAERMPDISFVIVGNKNPIINVPSNILAIGRTENQNQLAQWYSLADVTLLTSKKETFSMVAAESLCCGSPVVGFDAGAPSEVAPEGYGVFTPYGDIIKLEKSIRYGLEGGLLGKSECAEFGKAKYSKEVMVHDYMELYKS